MSEGDPNESMWEDIAICSSLGRADDLVVSEADLVAIMRNAGIADEHVRYVLESRSTHVDYARYGKDTAASVGHVGSGADAATLRPNRVTTNGENG